MDNINAIIARIKELEAELSRELQRKEEELFYKVRGRRVQFASEVKSQHRRLVVKVHRYLLDASLASLLAAPIIWSCLMPLIFLDLVVSVYHGVCFPIYGIPRVRRSDYVVIDRYALAYLNVIEKINCVYCGYANGLIAYVREIAARTEQYWCPIRHARRVAGIHSRYSKFVEYGDAKRYREMVETIRRDFRSCEGEEESCSR
ncbi:MAG: hypothetical protein AB1634_12290 [Thermodesulfobacteriota bacterium]